MSFNDSPNIARGSEGLACRTDGPVPFVRPLRPPVVGLAYDPKVRAFFRGLGLERAVLPWGEEFQGEHLQAAVSAALVENHAQRHATAEVLTRMRARAALAVDLALARWRRN